MRYLLNLLGRAERGEGADSSMRYLLNSLGRAERGEGADPDRAAYSRGFAHAVVRVTACRSSVGSPSPKC